MRVAIGGAGNVGRSIAAELVENGHEVLLIDKDPREIKADTLPEVEWLLADACELSSLEEAGLDTCDVAIAATGDDKVNLVMSLLARRTRLVCGSIASVTVSCSFDSSSAGCFLPLISTSSALLIFSYSFPRSAAGSFDSASASERF